MADNEFWDIKQYHKRLDFNKRGGIGGDLWNTLTQGLDADERLVSPKIYIENRDLYASVRAVAYIIRYLGEDEENIDWVFESALAGIMEKHGGNVEILEKQLVVKIRLPWVGVEGEWLITQDELDAHREEYEVLEIYLKLRPKDDPTRVVHSRAIDYDRDWAKYDVLDARYLVCWKFTPETESRLLGIDKSSFRTFMEQ